MVQGARQELEAAGKLGTEPPVWVAQITTPAGWEHYRRLAQAGEKAQGDA